MGGRRWAGCRRWAVLALEMRDGEKIIKGDGGGDARCLFAIAWLCL